MTMTISKQQDDHHEHHDHDHGQHRNNHNHSNNNNVEYSLEKNKDCTTTINTSTNTRLESIFHGKTMIQSSSSSSSTSRSLPPYFEIPKTLMSNDSIDNDNNNINYSEKSIKFLRGLYKRATTCTTTSSCDDHDHDHDHEILNDPTDTTSTTLMVVITGILEEIDRDNSNKIDTTMEEDCDYDTNDEEDEDSDDDDDDDDDDVIVPIQYDNYVNKRQMLSKDMTSIVGKRRNELLLDDASGMYDAVQAMKFESELLSSGDEEEDDDDDDNDL
jgi:hypothetical protein